MVLPGMDLPNCPAYSRLVVTYYNKQILRYISQFRIHAHNFDMCEALAIRTNFILAFYNQNSPFSQDTPCFPPGVAVEIQYRLMIFAAGSVPASVVPVVGLERLVPSVRRPSRRVHIGRVKNHTINPAILIGQITAVNAVLNVGCAHLICACWDAPPENTSPVCHIRNDGTRRDIESEDSGKYAVVSFRESAAH